MWAQAYITRALFLTKQSNIENEDSDSEAKFWFSETVYQSTWAVITEFHRLTQHKFTFSQFSRLDVQDQATNRVGFW